MDIKTAVVPLKNWWWLIVIAVLIAGGSTFFIASQQPPVYRSRVTLRLGNTIQNTGPTSGEFNIIRQLVNDYVSLADREIVRSAAMDSLGIDWLPEYSVWVVPNTSLIQITVFDSTPKVTQAVATELARQLIRLGPGGAEEDEQVRQLFVQDQLDRLQVQIEETQTELDGLQVSLGDLFSAREIAEAETQIAALSNKLNTLQRSYAELISTTRESSPNVLRVIEPAFLPEKPLDSEILNTVLTAIAAGASVAIAAAYLLEYLDDTVKDEEDVAKISGLPIFASIAELQPQMKRGPRWQQSLSGETRARWARWREKSQIDLTLPISLAAAESFRQLRTSIMFAGMDGEKQVMLITSPQPNAGKSFVAANLARSMAQADLRVLLIDADMRVPSQHEEFGFAKTSGLSNALLRLSNSNGKSNPRQVLVEAVRETEVKNLHVMTAGNRPPTPSELLSSQMLRTLLKTAKEQYDYVLVDSSPCLPVTDPIALSTQVDGVLIVLRAKHTRTGDVKKTLRQFSTIGATVLGVALNGVPPNKRYYGNYHLGDPSILSNLPQMDQQEEVEAPKTVIPSAEPQLISDVSD